MAVRNGHRVFAATGIGLGAYAEYICLRENPQTGPIATMHSSARSTSASVSAVSCTKACRCVVNEAINKRKRGSGVPSIARKASANTEAGLVTMFMV